MPNGTHEESIDEQVRRVVRRSEELGAANRLLRAQLETMTAERDALLKTIQMVKGNRNG